MGKINLSRNSNVSFGDFSCTLFKRLWSPFVMKLCFYFFFRRAQFLGTCSSYSALKKFPASGLPRLYFLRNSLVLNLCRPTMECLSSFGWSYSILPSGCLNRRNTYRLGPANGESLFNKCLVLCFS